MQEPPARFKERQKFYRQSQPKQRHPEPTPAQLAKRRAKKAKKWAKKFRNKLKTWASEMREDMTPAEAVIWEYMKIWEGKYRPVAQRPLGKYIADFAWRKFMLVVEVDGGYHLNPDQRAKDKIRELDMKRMGYSTLRFTNEQCLENTWEVVQIIGQRLGLFKEPEPVYVPPPINEFDEMLFAAVKKPC